MAWPDRQKTASYTSTSGKKFDFQWEDAEESFDHKASVFRFPDQDGAQVLSLGTGEHRFPITAFITGDDYDIDAQTAMDILAEKGAGVLVHPIYGTKTVQPTNIKRSDDGVSEAGQAKISILFIETENILAKETEEDVKKKIEEKQDDFDQDTPEEFETQKRDDTAQNLANSEARMDRSVSVIDEILGPIAEFNEEVNAQFKAISLSLNGNLTDLVGKPLTLASQTIALIKTPARIIQSLTLRIQGYIDLAEQLRNRATINAITNDTRNTLLETRFMLSGCTAAMAETILLEDFTLKSDALGVAQTLRDFHALNRDFIETQEALFHNTPLELLLYGDSEESKNLTEIVELTSNLLATNSFNLQQEITIETVRPRNIIELTHELYGNSDSSTIDLLISTNKLSGDEIILIPSGREIVYYA